MDKRRLFEFYKNNIESNWANILSIPDTATIKESFEKFYQRRKELILVMSNDFRSGNTKVQTVCRYIKKVLCNNWYFILGALMLYYMFKRYHHDRKFKLYYKKTDRNLKILKFLDKIIRSYKPTFYLPGPYPKIFYIALKTSKKAQHFYLRYEHTLHDGETIALDFYPKNHDVLSRTTPTICFFPGVFGDSLEGYSFELVNQVYAKLGWRVCIIHRRGYGGMPIRGDKLSSFARHDETHEVLTAIQTNYPESNLYIIGVSLGACGVQRYLEEYGEEVFAKGACAIASPWDVVASGKRLRNNWLCNWALVNEYKQNVRQHMHEANFLRIMKDRGFSEGKKQQFNPLRIHA
jgi:pimeloyl-ACP methyl ester carboxylesterase